MDFDFDESSSDESGSEISSYESTNSDSEMNNSLVEDIDESSINDWDWDTNDSSFATSFSYFDGCALGNSDNIRPIDSFSKFIDEDMIKLHVDQTNVYGKQRCAQRSDCKSNWKKNWRE